MSERDEDDDDPQLDSLRGAWRSLPDEDPPERGLGELMAAARAKAEEMAAPTWWQRIVAVLRRPPVLALATILVLIGGAIVISRRHEVMTDVAPTAQPGPMIPAAAGSAAPAQGEISGGYAEKAQPKLDQVPTTATTNAPKPPAHRTVRATTPVRPKAERPPAAKQDDDGVQAATGDLDAPEVPARRAKDSMAEGEAVSPIAGVTQAQTFSDPATTAPARDLTPKQGPTSQQLLEQSRSAAARGDCTAARVMARKLEDHDATFYRANIARESQIQRCLSKQ